MSRARFAAGIAALALACCAASTAHAQTVVRGDASLAIAFRHDAEPTGRIALSVLHPAQRLDGDLHSVVTIGIGALHASSFTAGVLHLGGGIEYRRRDAVALGGVLELGLALVEDRSGDQSHVAGGMSLRVEIQTALAESGPPAAFPLAFELLVGLAPGDFFAIAMMSIPVAFVLEGEVTP